MTRKKNISREIDVVATYEKPLGKSHYFRITFVVECKQSSDKPWIIFSSNQSNLNNIFGVKWRMTSEIGENLLYYLSKQENIRTSSLFRLENAAYGVIQAFKSGNTDITYNSILSVTKAAIAHKKTTNEKLLDILNKPAFEIIFPLVVFNSPLFSSHLDASSNLCVNKINIGNLLWKNFLSENNYSVVHIIPIDSLASFVHEAKKTCDQIFQMCKTELKDYIQNDLENWRKKVFNKHLPDSAFRA